MSSHIKIEIVLRDRQGETPGQIAEHVQRAIEQYELIDNEERFVIDSLSSCHVQQLEVVRRHGGFMIRDRLTGKFRCSEHGKVSWIERSSFADVFATKKEAEEFLPALVFVE